MNEQFSRTAQLVGEENVKKLFSKHVIVFGCGGVGGFVVEALARSGIGKISLVDNDSVNISNINRQIIALHSTVGKQKVDILKNKIPIAKFLHSIHFFCQKIHTHLIFHNTIMLWMQ